MNIQFSKIVKADGKLREFNFTRLSRQKHPLAFSVDVTDGSLHRICFDMLKENDNWKIVQQQIPRWVLENENKLHVLIEEELNEAAVA
ncbi:MAG TPA: hypothetical protein PKC39_12660 [Ferruginibacter sp.]|nr:hypothetical protein [Ferruginibacter sp.]HMP21803.1 hypothetical protein [Ferruginibacter sp.]